MAKTDGFDRETNLPGGSFSRLLLSDDEGDTTTTMITSVSHCPISNCFSPTLFSANTPKMLCFGDRKRNRNEIDLGFVPSLTTSATTTTPKASSPSYKIEPAICASTSSNDTNSISSSTKSNKKRNGSAQKSEKEGPRAEPVATNTMGGQRNCKKNKGENNNYRSTSSRHAKVKREKMGERIVALQQLVSPFGKTDTASVLHEAMGYIRFLQDQVKVLCSPYLLSKKGEKREKVRVTVLRDLYFHQQDTLHPIAFRAVLSSNTDLQWDDKVFNKEDKSGSLRRKGLCMIPVECVIHVANSNGADFWSSNTVDISSKK